MIIIVLPVSNSPILFVMINFALSILIQQFQLIKQMAEAFFVKTKVIGVKTVREIDGLAMSSRNMRLTAVGRKQAPLIYKALTEAKSSKDAIRILNAADIQVEYLEEHNGRRYVAAIIDGVRLIDNVEI